MALDQGLCYVFNTKFQDYTIILKFKNTTFKDDFKSVPTHFCMAAMFTPLSKSLINKI